MRILSLIFGLVLLFTGISCDPQTTTNSEENRTAYYAIEIPKKHSGNSSSAHQVIVLDSDKSIHKLNFGTFSTESTIEIFRSDSTNRPLIKQHLGSTEKQIVDISKFGKGMYKVLFTAIAQSCVFQLEIK